MIAPPASSNTNKTQPFYPTLHKHMLLHRLIISFKTNQGNVLSDLYQSTPFFSFVRWNSKKFSSSFFSKVEYFQRISREIYHFTICKFETCQMELLAILPSDYILKTVLHGQKIKTQQNNQDST